MTPRADAELVRFHANARTDAERRAFTRRVMPVVRHHLSGFATLDLPTYEAMVWPRIARDLEPIMEEWYGAWPADPRARFLRLIVDECRTARALAFRRAIEDIRRRLPEPIWRAIRREAA